MNTLYTLGYTGLKPDEILRAAERLDAIIADIRIAPRSRHPMWNAAKMRAAWGERYIYIPELGNENYKGERVEGFSQRGWREPGDPLKFQRADTPFDERLEVGTMRRTHDRFHPKHAQETD